MFFLCVVGGDHRFVGAFCRRHAAATRYRFIGGHDVMFTQRFSSLQQRYCSEEKAIHSCADTTFVIHESAKSRAQQAFSVFARQGRTWRRLSHVVDLAIQVADGGDKFGASNKTVVDVGTDHGLLAMGLVLSGRFEKVVGVDISEQALQNGAMALLGQIQAGHTDVKFKALETQLYKTPLEFRFGDGLEALHDGEANVICIAGMGVNTMLQILQRAGGQEAESQLDLDRVFCTALILQPTNSKPRNLMLLYKTLQNRGWKVRDERIEQLSSRWYLTTVFDRGPPNTNVRPTMDVMGDDELIVPGSILDYQLGDDNNMREVLDAYLRHHKQWIQKDAKCGKQDLLESLWLSRFTGIQ